MSTKQPTLTGTRISLKHRSIIRSGRCPAFLSCCARNMMRLRAHRGRSLRAFFALRLIRSGRFQNATSRRMLAD